MRLRAVLALSFVCASSCAKKQAPPFAEILKQATAEQKPILLDMTASWCTPCKKMDQETWPHPAVRDELRAWVLQQYDAEVGEGEVLAQKFEVNSYPSLIVLAPDGVELARLNEREPVALAARLHSLHDGAVVKVPDAATLATTQDARLLSTAARRATSAQEQQALWTRTLEVDQNGAAGLGAEAALKLAIMDLGAREAAALESLVMRFPDSPQAVSAFSALATLPKPNRPSHERLTVISERLAQAHATSANACGLNDPVYALLFAKEGDLALSLAQQMVAHCPGANYLDTLAEAHHQVGHREKAVEFAEKAVAAEPGQDAFRENLKRFRSGTPGPAPGASPAPNPVRPR